MLRQARAIVIAVLLTAVNGPPVGADEKSLTDQEVAAWVRQRVQDWQPTAADRPFDEIGWAKDIREAERLARAHDRPVFLFTHDGHMAIGRC
jgi:predicted amidohydrolase YtcJ